MSGKNKILVSLAAIGVLGGFFVYQAVAESGMTVITPTSGVWRGEQEIRWATDCSGNGNVIIKLEANNNPMKI